MKDPAFLFYSKDWLEGTADLTAEEKGVYIDLLSYQHQRGYIPEDTTRIAILVGMDHKGFLSVWSEVSKKFARQMPGKLINNKLFLVSNERSKYSKMRKIIGTFGAQLRALDAKDSLKEKIRKAFNYKEFEDCAEQELANSLAIWLANWQANSLPTYGNANESVDLGISIYNTYYDLEIEKSKKDENYLKFVKVLFGENPLGKPLDAVLKMPEQISFEQFGYLWAIKEKTGCRITDVLLKMENWKDLSKRKTVLETFRTFATPKEK